MHPSFEYTLKYSWCSFLAIVCFRRDSDLLQWYDELASYSDSAHWERIHCNNKNLYCWVMLVFEKNFYCIYKLVKINIKSDIVCKKLKEMLNTMAPQKQFFIFFALKKLQTCSGSMYRSELIISNFPSTKLWGQHLYFTICHNKRAILWICFTEKALKINC